MIIYEKKSCIYDTKLDKTLVKQERPTISDYPWTFTVEKWLDAFELKGRKIDNPMPRLIERPTMYYYRHSVKTKGHSIKVLCASDWNYAIKDLGHTYGPIFPKYRSAPYCNILGKDSDGNHVSEGDFHPDLMTKYTGKKVKHAHIYVKSAASGAANGWVGYHQCYLDSDQLKEIQKFAKIKMRACDMYHEDLCYGWAWIETNAGGNYVPLHRLQSLVGV